MLLPQARYTGTPEQQSQAVAQGVETVFTAMDSPLNALQGFMAEGTEGAAKGFSQEKQYDFLDAMSPEFKGKHPEIAAGLAVAGDFLLDPLNLVGANFLSKGAKATRGLEMAGISNYIDNFYGYSTPKDYSATKVRDAIARGEADKLPPEHLSIYNDEKATLETFKDLESLNEDFPQLNTLVKKFTKGQKTSLKDITKREEKVALVKKVLGFEKFGKDVLQSSLGDYLSPYSRALYRNTGVSRGTQKRIQEGLKEGGSFGERKAVAQAQYNRHILEQAQRRGATAEQLKQVEKSYIDGYQPLTVQNYIESANKAPKFIKTPEYEKVAKELKSAKSSMRTAKTEEAVARNRKRVDNLERTLAYYEKKNKYETPQVITANLFDKAMKAWKAPPNTTLAVKEITGLTGDHAYDLLNKNPASAAARSIFKNQDIKTIDDLSKAFEGKGVKIVGRDSTGIYVQSATTSTSFTEGGVNVLIHVSPTGEAHGIISDVHDFLEKVPVLGKAIGKQTPQNVIAITPPISTNFSSKGASNIGTAVRKNKDVTLDELQAIADLKPTAGMLLGEAVRPVGYGMLLEHNKRKEKEQ